LLEAAAYSICDLIAFFGCFALKDLLQTGQKDVLESLEAIASVTITNFEEN